jgi:hypothetical protein
VALSGNQIELLIVLLALGAGAVRGVWVWMEDREAAKWPIVPATIDNSVLVDISKRRKNETGFVVKIYFTYSVNGEKQSGKYERPMSLGDAAERLLANLKGKSIPIHVNPGDPADFFIADAEIDLLAEPTLATQG